MEGGDDADARRCMEWDESNWDRKILSTHRTLVRARRERPWLAWGSFEDAVVDDDRGLYAYRRAESGPLAVLDGEGPGQLWVAVNVGKSRSEIRVPLGARACKRSWPESTVGKKSRPTRPPINREPATKTTNTDSTGTG